MPITPRPTLEDVARVSGYSRATISRVVRNVENVDPRIVTQVNKAIEETGYRINLAARALAGGSTQTIGIVFRENFSHSLCDEDQRALPYEKRAVQHHSN